LPNFEPKGEEILIIQEIISPFMKLTADQADAAASEEGAQGVDSDG